MAKGRSLSAAHKAAISAGLKRYWAGKRAGGSGAKPKQKIINIDTGKAISMEEAAVRMFGTAGAAKKLAARSTKKRR